MIADPPARPVWATLTTRQARFAVGDAGARRFAPDVGPLAGARDDTRESIAALAALVPEDGALVLLQGDPIVVPPGCIATVEAAGVQMVAEQPIDLPRDPRAQRLTDADTPAMLELATLTGPGPFAIRTASLGEFWGIKERGVLLAMAGERMKHPGLTEVSGVCTHPDARGRGLARALSALVVARIVERGETPYLHAYAANAAAIALYESLGFRIRRPVNVAMIARATSSASP
jgi:predicted GNAT family acetyltransferase